MAQAKKSGLSRTVWLGILSFVLGALLTGLGPWLAVGADDHVPGTDRVGGPLPFLILGLPGALLAKAFDCGPTWPFGGLVYLLIYLASHAIARFKRRGTVERRGHQR